MKKRILRIIVIVLCVLLFFALTRTALVYFGNYVPNKAYFGSDYEQVIYPTSIPDYLIAKEVLKKADTALSTITDDKNAEGQFGKLGYLCVTDDEAVSEKHKLDFIAADFSKGKGYLWVKYSSEAYDENGEVTCGSGGSEGILARWELEKINDRWIVISTKESP